MYPIGEWWTVAPTLCGDSVGVTQKTQPEENQREVQCVTSGA
jgi:hypothetical protein